MLFVFLCVSSFNLNHCANILCLSWERLLLLYRLSFVVFRSHSVLLSADASYTKLLASKKNCCNSKSVHCLYCSIVVVCMCACVYIVLLCSNFTCSQFSPSYLLAIIKIASNNHQDNEYKKQITQLSFAYCLQLFSLICFLGFICSLRKKKL